jgi:two-component system LytT family response regulator
LVTAYDEHALRAFEAQAIDYVLKPIDPERFAVTLNRLRALFTKGRPPRRLLLRDGARILAFDEDDIEWIEADGDYVRIHGAEKPTLVRQTLSDLERRLGGSHFVRAHRSAIVNVDRIREATPEGDRGLRLVMRSGRAVRVSRGHGDEKRALESHECAARRAFPEMDTHARRASRRQLVIEERPDQSHHIVAMCHALEIRPAALLVLHQSG